MRIEGIIFVIEEEFSKYITIMLENDIIKKKDKLQRRVCVLLSGGIDSTACLKFYLDLKKPVFALHVSYGQSSEIQELRSAKRISKYYKVELKIVKWQGIIKNKKDYICGRNAFLLVSALLECSDADSIALGIHSGTEYLDCTEAFVKKMQDVFDIYSKGVVQIGVPFLKWSKRDIWDYCQNKNVPLQFTYSCEYGRRQPCGKCLSCKDLEALC